MELKYAAGLLEHLYDIRYQQCGNIPNYKKSHEAQALQTAISHLETLQKVKEMGGVKKISYFQLDKRIPDLTDDESLNSTYAKGFNNALDLKEAELAGKLDAIDNQIKSYCINILKIDITSEGAEKLAMAIQELILGKKEE